MGVQPNILVIIADDLGWADLSSYGAPHIKTPNLDRLAEQGLRFTNGYAGSATCSPTRLSFLTGGYPGRTRAGLHEPIATVSPDVGLDPATPTLPRALSAAGYHTALIGKWHCGSTPWFGPLKSGFDEFFGNTGGALDYFSKITNRGEYDLHYGDDLYHDLTYYTHLLSDKAVEFIERPHERPWFLSLNYTAPHWPWEGPQDEELSATLTARILGGESRVLAHRDGGSVETYASMVEELDASIGKVLDALEAEGVADETFVLFFSDNGGERYSYQWPLSGEKFSLLEGGIRVPTIARWSGHIASGVSEEPVVTMDWTRTLLEIANVHTDEVGYDGADLAPHLLEGDALDERDLFWRIRSERALRRGQWKYYAKSDGQSLKESLFNLDTDIRERSNYAQSHPEVFESLREGWERIDAELLPYE